MSNYEICYLDNRRVLIAYIFTACAGDAQAVSFAHAMSFPGHVRIEIWSSGSLIHDFARPHSVIDRRNIPTLAHRARHGPVSVQSRTFPPAAGMGGI